MNPKISARLMEVAKKLAGVDPSELSEDEILEEYKSIMSSLSMKPIKGDSLNRIEDVLGDLRRMIELLEFLSNMKG